jgi:hypothetical protein
LLGGCKRDIKNDDAVRQGITIYLAKHPDLFLMDVNVTSVTDAPTNSMSSAATNRVRKSTTGSWALGECAARGLTASLPAIPWYSF